MVWGFSLLALLPALAEAARLAVLRVGDGSSALNSASAPIFIDTYSTTGTLESSFAVPDLTLSGSATSEGALSLSADGQYITFAGYRVAAGTANVASSAASTVPRGIATLDRSSNYVLRAQLTGSFSGNNIRGAATVDGSKFYVVGVNSGAGMLLVNPSSPTPTTTIVASPTNIRAVTIDQGHVLFSTGSGTAGVYRVGDKNTFPTTQTASTLLAAQGSPYGMALVSEDTLFVADDSAGVVRFVKTDATFTKNQTIAGGIRGVRNAERDHMERK
ncbi:hypothetical protein BJ742DRAFT_343552 [Cladochytrium replicatum]|nr:hypothetical protein BJ742DRAFT_343552 [Cladochytrium replicatum]